MTQFSRNVHAPEIPESAQWLNVRTPIRLESLRGAGTNNHLIRLADLESEAVTTLEITDL